MLSAFSISALQEAVVVLRLLDGAGVRTVSEAISRVGQAIGGSVQAQGEAEQVRRDNPSCPSCGQGHLYICSQTSAIAGHPVRVCSHHCGYSEVANG